MRIFLILLLSSIVLCGQAEAQSSRLIQSSDITGALGYTPIASPITGDATTSGNVITLNTVNSNVGSFGSSTSCVSFTTNAKGLITAASAVTCSPAISSITGLGTGVATALGINIGSIGAPVLFNGAGGTPSSLALTNATGLVPTTGLSVTGAASSTTFLRGDNAWSTSVTSITPDGGIVSSTTANCSQSAIITSGTLSSASCPNAQTGTTYAILNGDRAKIILASNVAAQAYSIAQAGAASQFASGWYVDIENNSTTSAGVITITPTTSQICAQGTCAATYKIQPGAFARIISDGTNYQVTSNPTSFLTYTPTITCSSGTLTTGTVNSASTMNQGSVMDVQFDITLTSLGTCTGFVILTVPTYNSVVTGTAFEVNNGTGMAIVQPQSATTITLKLYNNGATAQANDRWIGGVILRLN